MRAMRAEQFSGYEALKLVELPKPAVSDGKVLVRITAAGVTPLDHTILSGKFPISKAPLVLGNEGAGVVEEGGGADFPVGSRVMFIGAYGVFEDGTYSEWVAVRKENLCLIPDGVDDVSAAGLPAAYLTAHMTLSLAGFQAGKTVLAPAIGGSVGNAVTQLARALGAKHAISSTTNHAKAEQAKALGFNEVIDISFEKLGDGVRRITGGDGADIVIDGVGGEVLSEALGALALDGASQHRVIREAAKRPLTSQIRFGNGPASRASSCSLSRGRPGRTPGTRSSLCFNPARSNRSWLRPSRWPRRLMLCVTRLRASRSAESFSQSDRP